MKNPHHLHHLFIGTLILLFLSFTLGLLTSNAHAASNIHGTVTDAETDDPITEAVVHVYDPENKRENYQRTETDRTGYYEVEVEPGHYEIKIEKNGYETHTGEEDVGIEEQVEHNAELVPEEETYLEGYVTDSDTGDPVEGADVTLHAEREEDEKKVPTTILDEKDEDDRKLSAVTDSEGYYNITCKEGQYTIDISMEGYETYKERVRIAEGGNRHDALLTKSTGDGRGGGGGNGDDDGFDITGSDGIMVMGWVLAAVLLVVLVLQRRDSGLEDGGLLKPTKRRAGPAEEPGEISPKPRKRSHGSEKDRCPVCDSKGDYNEKYDDHYCWKCRDYFEDL